jgi:hypothetical protein
MDGTASRIEGSLAKDKQNLHVSSAAVSSLPLYRERLSL